MIKGKKEDTAGEIGTEAPHPHPKIAKETKRASVSTETEAKAAKEKEATQETRNVIMFLWQTESIAKNRVKKKRERRNQRGALLIQDDEYINLH